MPLGDVHGSAFPRMGARQQARPGEGPAGWFTGDLSADSPTWRSCLPDFRAVDSIEVPVLTDDPSTVDALKSVSGPGVHRYMASLVTTEPAVVEVHVHGMRLGRLDDAISRRYLPFVLDAYDRGHEPQCVAILDLVDGASALTVQLPADLSSKK